jgi:hypothetical protein
MSIHRLNPGVEPQPALPLDVGLSLSYRSYYFTDTVVRARAARGLSATSTHLPIYRQLRFAARCKLEMLFDDIAVGAGAGAHRLEEGYVLLDGPGVFVSARGAWKSGYSSVAAGIWAESPSKAEQMRETLLAIVGERRMLEQTFRLNWHFSTGDGSLSSAAFEELVDEELMDEAYPSLGESVRSFAQRYLSAPETVLVLQGPPGTGKTRLVRAILGEISRRKGESAEVMYTSDKRALEKDELFVEFITGSHDAFVIEDADHLLKSRASGNTDLHRFLSVADGVVRAQGRKIIFTTNLPNIGDIDDALLRPGRCFASVRARTLTLDEAQRLVAKMYPQDESRCEQVLGHVFADGSRSASLAMIYRACTATAAARA